MAPPMIVGAVKFNRINLLWMCLIGSIAIQPLSSYRIRSTGDALVSAFRSNVHALVLEKIIAAIKSKPG